MKNTTFFIYAGIAAILFNLKAFQVDVWDRLTSYNFPVLVVVVMGLFWTYASWITIQYGEIATRQENLTKKSGIASLSSQVIARYMCSAIFPVLVFHLVAVWCLASIAEDTHGIFIDYMLGYLPLLFAMTAGYAVLLLFRPDYALANSFVTRDAKVRFKEVEAKEVSLEQKLEQAMGLYGLFFFLKHKGGMGPIFKDASGTAVRFLDIVLISSFSKQRYVFLSDGDKLGADGILKELKKRGLDRWMIKISKNYYINMLLVVYPIIKPKKRLVLQKDIRDGMLNRMKSTDIDKMCEIGPGMSPDILKDFLADKKSMDYKGWDDFIPLH